jgi:parvulin-like peptidyl-prolyl isomerase
MTPSSRLFSRAVVALFVGALVLTACGTSSSAAQNVAATVGGTTVDTAQVARMASVFRAVAALQQQQCGQTDGATDTPEAACNRFALSALILFALSDAYASGHGITASDAEVEQSYSGFEQGVGKDTLATQLQANGVTTDDVKSLIRSSLTQNAVAKAVTEERLGPDGLRKQYEDSIAGFTKLHVDHILVKTEAEADRIYRQVTAPGFTLPDFQSLARKVSTDPNAKQDGGELSLPAAQLAPEFAAAASALAPGEISKPVQTQFGWHVIWKIGQDVQSFSQVKDQLLQQAQQDQFGGWMREQTADDVVTVDPSFGRFDPQQLAVVRITSTDPSATPPTPTTAANATTPPP